MAEIRPFRGLRYNQEMVRDLAAVLCPPYDVISAEAQQRYHARSPYNVIRLEYGETFPQDNEKNNRYTRAREYLHRWLRDSVLLTEEKPAFYLCQDEFSFHHQIRRRTGLVVALKATPYEQGEVLPHEETLPRAKADRLQLLTACRTNFSSIFTFYQDETGEVASLLAPCLATPPLLTVTDDEGVTHRLWRIMEEDTVTALQRAFAGKKLFVADGHHRYETACQFARQYGQEYAYVMATLVDIRDPGLVVLPTHRLIRGGLPIAWERVAGYFERRSFSTPQLLTDHAPLGDFLATMAEVGATTPCFGIYAGGDAVELLTLRHPDLLDLLPADKPKAYRELDVTVLHELFLKPALGLDAEEIASEGRLAYTRDPQEAWQKVRQGEFQLAVFLNPPRLEQITAVAAAGARMPQKSTYFWPKLVTGLVMFQLDVDG